MLDRQAANSYVSSIIALALGIVLAVGVSAFFGLIGWGGEWASQVAGATSGAAPLIIDGIRQRRRRDPRDDLNALRRRRQIWPRLLIASIFGFAVLLLDSVVGLVMYRVTRAAINLAHGDQDRFVQTYTLLGSVTTLPYVIAGTFLLAIAAGHRLGEASRRTQAGFYARIYLHRLLPEDRGSGAARRNRRRSARLRPSATKASLI
jgi:hypothetical protein